MIKRILFVTDKDGVEREIKSKQDLLDIMAQMTPSQKADWKTRYRFSPIKNMTGIKDYTGTLGDI